MSGHGRKDHLVMNTFGTSLDEQHLATGISMLDCLLQGSANFFCKKPDGKYLGFVDHSLCHNYWALPL